MRLLLDTNILLRSIREPARLSDSVAMEIADRRTDVVFSVASVWEIGIKSSLGRADFQVDPQLLLETARLDFREIPITSADALRAAALPFHHRDPFDRLLIAQAIGHDATLLTTDRALLLYGGPIRLVV